MVMKGGGEVVGFRSHEANFFGREFNESDEFDI